MPTVDLRFAAMEGHVRTARMIATAVGRRAGVPLDLIDEIKLAVGEACVRAVQVSRRRAPDAFVHVRLTDSVDAFTVEVSDCGAPGDDMAPGPMDMLIPPPELITPAVIPAEGTTPGAPAPPEGARPEGQGPVRPDAPRPGGQASVDPGQHSVRPDAPRPTGQGSPRIATTTTTGGVQQSAGEAVQQSAGEAQSAGVAEAEPLPPGVGLALIDCLVDEVDVRAREGGNGTVVTMIWHTGPKPPDAAGPAEL
jgi:anti-sigma regulatory factor (Ser/Thr protein kinase)